MQVPVTYAVNGTAPVRCGGVVQAPYTLINTSSEHTVWVSHNAGMGIGQGTPLFPGATLVWQHDGDFYAICEDATEGAQVIATKDAIDIDPNPVALAIAILNSGLLVIDDPVMLFNDWTTNPGVDLDISRFQSVIVALNLNNSAGNLDMVTISFEGMFDKSIMFSAVTTGAPSWEGTFPCLAATMRIDNESTIVVPTGISAVVWGSHRPAVGIAQTHMRDITGNIPTASAPYFYFDTGMTILAGANLLINLPPWFGEIDIDVELTSAAALVAGSSLLVSMKNPATGVFSAFRREIPTPIIAGSTVYHATMRVSYAGASSRVQIFNGNAVNFTGVNVRISPVNGFGVAL